MPWHASLRLHYRRDHETTRAHSEHVGPLRVLKALYPEGAGICHHTVLHPPSGIVGGDTLDLSLTLEGNAHAVLTTPGASRFYRCDGDTQAAQNVSAVLHPGARLEWLPQENLAYSGTRMLNEQRFSLAPEAEMFGCDVLALGLPASNQPFVAGSITQRIELRGLWLERSRIQALDQLLLHSALGLAGRSAMATMWWAAGSAIGTARAARALELARTLLPAGVAGAGLAAGASQVHPQVLVLRALAPQTEPLTQLVRAVRSTWRQELWGLGAAEPRVWAS